MHLDKFLFQKPLCRFNLLLLLLFPLFSLHLHCLAKEPAAKPDIRIINFPTNKSIGALLVLHKSSAGAPYPTFASGLQVGGALGRVIVTVPPNSALMLDANRRVFENPVLLKDLPASSIDMLRLSFISMDVKEDSMFDRAISYVSGMKDLKALCVDRSEASDASLSKLKNLPHLCSINCFLTSVRGSCFKEFSKFPELNQLDVVNCKIDQKNLIYLSQFPKLKYLKLAATGVDADGAKLLSNCKSLVSLDLGSNPKVNDICITNLVHLTKLQYLDLKGTAVTYKGVCALHALKLKRLSIPVNLNAKVPELTSMFPGAEIVVAQNRQPVSASDQKDYAPLR